jgi:hypothetical protein
MKRLFKLALFLFLIINNLSAQDTLTYVINKVSFYDSSLYFNLTDKRGIQDKAGTIYYVEKDLQTLTAYHNFIIKWRSNVIDSCGKPYIGTPKIRFLKLEKDRIFVIFGKHSFASIDYSTGKIKCLGSD